MSATYIHFTLVNHIEVVSFIAWREEKKGETQDFVCESRKKQDLEPTGKPTLPITSTSCLSSQKVDF